VKTYSNSAVSHPVPPLSAVPPESRDPNARASEPSPSPDPAGAYTNPPPLHNSNPPPLHDATPPSRARAAGISERVIEMVCAYIREYGMSDSAAAVKTGMSASTISRWKHDFPEIALQLQQAREDCRIKHLEIIQKAAQAENARGVRAALWLAERLFPADYSARADEREAHQRVAEKREEREWNTAFHEGIREAQKERDAKAARRERAEQADREYKEALAAYQAQQAAAGEPPAETDAAVQNAVAEMHAALGSDLHVVK
jgi:transposase